MLAELSREEINAVDAIFNPMQAVQMMQEFPMSSVGKTPTGFYKVHTEVSPVDLAKTLGYDPRSLESLSRRGRSPQNVDPAIVELQKMVQRSIDQGKVDAMVNYLYEAVVNGKFADWAAIELVTVAEPDFTTYPVDRKVRFPQAADYFITDGQHRYCALLDFIRQHKELANRFTQTVAISVLPVDKMRAWAGQSFHDKNYLATPVKATKALSVDERDLHNQLAKSLWKHPVILEAGGVNDTKASLSMTAPEFATHAVLFKFARAFAEGRRGLDKGTGALDNTQLTAATFEATRQDLFDYVTELNRVFPHWSAVPGREEYLFRASAALQAFGVIGHLLYTRVADPQRRRQMLEAIGERNLDWKRTNTAEWAGVIGQVKDGDTAVSPASSRQAFDGTIKFLRERSGLDAYLTVTS